MNNSFRIRTTPDGKDKYINIKLQNDIDFYEILSLKISQKDIYANFNSDNGVLIGRVIANGSVGIPNAKISVFIPITDSDKTNSAVNAIYSYKTPRDKDLNGIRYNLLPRVAVNNPFLTKGQYAPTVPIGTFPTKEEVTTNDSFLEVFEKYYKFTTVTNSSGDYMIYGVPIGTQTVHMSVDITDIGKFSMSPATMITNLGYSPNLFTENGTKIKYSTDLDVLPNVETQEISVNVRPFWGDETNFEIGITRQDFKIRALLISSFTLFGAAFTDGLANIWGGAGNNDSENITNLYQMQGINGVNIRTKRNGIISENIIYLPNTINDSDISSGNFDTKFDYKKLDSSQYTAYKSNGQFIYIVPCNRKKIITNEFGNEVVVDNDSTEGIFTEFVGFMTFTLDDGTNLLVENRGDGGGDSSIDGHKSYANRVRLKFPQTGAFPSPAHPDGESIVDFGNNPYGLDYFNEVWRKQVYKFTGGTFYSVAKFNGTYYVDAGNGSQSNLIPNSAKNNNGTGTDLFGQTYTNGYDQNHTYYTGNIDITRNPGSILVDSGDNEYQFIPNVLDSNNNRFFGNQWLNFSIYFPQIINLDDNLNSGFDQDATTNKLLTVEHSSQYFINDNKQLIGDGLSNTFYYARPDINRTTFIQVPKEDILSIINATNDGLSKQGFTNTQAPYALNPLYQLIGSDYKGDLLGTNGNVTPSPIKVFYKGLTTTSGTATNGNADVFLYMRTLNII